MNELALHKLKESQYYLFNGKCFSEANMALYNTVYAYWRSFWEDVFKQNGCPKKLDSDDFVRQDFIAALTYKDEVIAVHLYSIFDARMISFKEHSYFKKYFDERTFSLVSAYNPLSLMSMEYMTVNPMWRKKYLGFSLAHVLGGLGLTVQDALSVDMALAPSRKDVKVNEIAEAYGGTNILSDVMLHNTPCDLMVILRENLRPHYDPVIAGWVDHFWKNRLDLTGRTEQKHIRLKMAA